jgi:hypothetical protein
MGEAVVVSSLIDSPYPGSRKELRLVHSRVWHSLHDAFPRDTVLSLVKNVPVLKFDDSIVCSCESCSPPYPMSPEVRLETLPIQMWTKRKPFLESVLLCLSLLLTLLFVRVR